MDYTNAELADMHLFYGRANGNGREARRLYVAAYPNRRAPSHKLFARIHTRLRETGTFSPRPRDRGRERFVRTPAVEERILHRVEENPGTSIRRIANMERVSPASVWRTVHEQLLYPYHIQRVQALNPTDYEQRLIFCRWFLHRCNQTPNFPALILCTDEAGFTRSGILNYHNNHVWADQNPHAFFESGHQQRFMINVWAGILGDRLVGPFVLPNRYNLSLLKFPQNV